MMTAAEQTLWNKIENFNLDDVESSFKFTDRLARENGWHIAYAHRVVAEYKKFIFLCCVSPTGVTPSDPVDQAWHLHLTYTKSYWVDFCRNTLEQEIHHNPTKGGHTEAIKFEGYYTHSFKLYEDKFGTQPPADIWQDNDTRFSDINFQRVNLNNFRVVKPWVFTVLKVSVYILLAILVLIGVMLLYVYTSSEFYIPLFVFVAIGGIVQLNSKLQGKKSNGSGCGGGGDVSYDSDSNDGDGHGGHGHSGDGHGDSSGCSGCSGSGCSGCGGGCGGD